MRYGHEKMNFLNAPTPLERLNTVSEELGINLYLKRDDLTNYGTGGNKLRKLEYFVKDALDGGYTMLLTVGGAQTNHGRLTAAVAARYGLKSAIVAVDEYPGEISANLLLDGIMDCHVYLAHKAEGQSGSKLLEDTVTAVTAEWESRGEKVYYIPMGGSNALGTLGYYDCACEIAQQVESMGLEKIRLVTTVGSMGTYVGLASAIANEHLDMKLTGITIMPYDDPLAYALDYYRDSREYLGLPEELTAEDLDLRDEFTYGAYNNPVEDVRQAIYYMGRKEGIILDPCYTGKTFNALMKLAAAGEFAPDETVIMLHTGGIPGIYTRHHRLEMEKELMDHIHIV